MPLYKLSSILLLSVLIVSCGKSLPELNQVDLAQFKADKNGCLQYRQAMTKQLETQKDKLLRLSENQILELLGKPDKTELYKRNQKFYTYFLTPGEACPTQSAATTLIIRFTAMGIANEVAIN